MWGWDYPHAEGTFPYSREAYRLLFADLTDDEIRAILGGTAAEVYGFDVAALQPIADRIGPTLEEIRTPLDSLPHSDSTTFLQYDDPTELIGRA
jgi:hypothetical protein